MSAIRTAPRSPATPGRLTSLQAAPGLALGLMMQAALAGPADPASPSAGARIREQLQPRPAASAPVKPAAAAAIKSQAPASAARAQDAAQPAAQAKSRQANPASAKAASPAVAGTSLRQKAISQGRQRLAARALQVDTTEAAAPLTVQSRDTVIGLSRHVLAYPQAWTEVAVFNQLPDANRIRVNQTLKIPLRLLKYQRQRAEILHVSGSAQLDGRPAKAGDLWDEGQTLATGEGASVQVRLADQSEVRVMPGTVARLGRHRDYAAQARLGITGFEGQVELKAGSLETLAAKGARRAAPLEVRTPTVAIGVRGTAYRVHFDRNATTRSEVLEGRVHAAISGMGLGEADLAAEQGVRHQAGETVVQPRALPPKPDLAGWPSRLEAGSATLALPRDRRHRVLVAKDPSMLDTVMSWELDTGVSLDLNSLGTGRWHLRVQALDDWGLASQDAFHVIDVVSPSPRVQPVPQAGAPASVVQSTEAGIELAWPASPATGRVVYEVQLLADLQGSQVLRQSEVDRPAWTVMPPAKGAAYFRYRIRTEQGTSGWSPVQPVTPAAGWRKWVPFVGV